MTITTATSIRYGNYKHILPAAQKLEAMIKKFYPKAAKHLTLPKGLKIIIRPIKGNTFGRCITTFFFDSQKTKIKHVEVDPRYMGDPLRVLETLFHELVHVDQFFTERLSMIYNGRTNIGRTFDSDRYRNATTHKQYLNLPWEIDARVRAKEMIDEFAATENLDRFVESSNITRKVYPKHY